jgi:spore maturation protein CgeB
MSLEDLGAHVLELNLGRHPQLISAPDASSYPRVPKQVVLKELKPFLDSFQPDIILCAAGGITFFEKDYKELMEKYITVGITVSDPEAYFWHGEENIYSHRFKYFFTNSVEAQRLYRDKHGIETYIFQMGCYPSFHRPMSVGRDFDVVVVGQAKPDRVEMVNELSKYFTIGLWGEFWEECRVKAFPEVHGRELVRAMNRGRFLISFARTISNRLAVKCHIFESTACKVPVLCEEFEEIAGYFVYEKEILGYRDLESLSGKIASYLKDYGKAEDVALNGYKRCMAEHTWHQRWHSLFDLIGQKEGRSWSLKKNWKAYYNELKFRLGFYGD